MIGVAVWIWDEGGSPANVPSEYIEDQDSDPILDSDDEPLEQQ